MGVRVSIKPSTNKKKKYMAVFNYGEDHKRKKTIHFGSAGMSDFTIHKDEDRKKRYLDRHRKRENWDKYMSAGSLSRYILWNRKTLKASIQDYIKRFNLTLKN